MIDQVGKNHIKGKYTILRKIGVGTYGKVFLGIIIYDH